MKKLSPKLLVYGMVLMLIAMVPISATAGATPNGQPFLEIWEELENLQNQIDNQTLDLSDLQAQLDAEIAARIAGDDALQAEIDAEEIARIAADIALQAAIDAEEAARIAADLVLQNNIDAEEAARIAADLALQAAINAEEAARIAADANLQTQINQEIADRIADVDSEEAARIADVNAEEAARIAADNTLQANINNLAAIDALDYDSLADLEAAMANGVNLAKTSGNVGIGTTSPGAKLDVCTSSGGAATIGHSSNSATGNWGIATGYNTHASGGYASTAMGYYVTASGDSSTAMGYRTTASGGWSTAMGQSTTASGVGSTAMGKSTTSSNFGSTAMGDRTTASGFASTAMGRYTIASGSTSTAMGRDTTASGHFATAMGYDTTASGQTSTAMGYKTTASGYSSTAMGRAITAQGSYSFGIGLDSTPRTITQSNTMAIMGGNVGIGTTSPDEKLHVAGNLKVDGSITIPTTTRHLSIAPGGFVPEDNSLTHTIDFLGSYHNLRGTNAGTTHTFYAPVQLPDGATITEFSAFIKDSDATEDISVELLRYTPSTGATAGMTGALSSSGTPGRSTLSTTSIFFSTVDSTDNVYLVRVQWKVPSPVTDIHLEGIFIDYEITTPLP